MKELVAMRPSLCSRRSFLECMAAFAAGRAFAAPPGMFAGSGVRLVFAAMSDIHVCHPATGRNLGTEVFERALSWYSRLGVDAVVVAGDLAEHGLVEELEMVGDAWRKMFPGDRCPDGRRVERVFVTGNHDYVAYAYGNFVKKLYSDPAERERHRLASHYAETWEAAFGEKYEPIYMKDVCGYRFIGSHWTGEEGEDGGEEWFGERLSDFLAAHGDVLRGSAPFFYVQHPHPKGSIAAGGAVCDDGRTTEVLSSFPNAVALSGHSHWSITDERSIWQGGFTSINLGCLRRPNFRVTKIAADGGRGYENWSTPRARESDEARAVDLSKAMPFYAAHFNCHQGMLARVFEDRIVIERREMGSGDSVAPDWVIPLSVAASAHPYDHRTREISSIAPQFAPDAVVGMEMVSAKNRGGKKIQAVKLTFPAANADKETRPYDYHVEIVGRDGKSTFRSVLAEGVDCGVESKLAQGASSCVLACDSLPAGPLVFKIRPGESFGKRGRPIVRSSGATPAYEVRGVLLHLGMNMWEDCRDYVRTSDDLWRRCVDRAAASGCNAIFVDLAEACAYPSHPELAVKGTWGVEKMRAELARMRSLGLEPLPKLNFSACHDAWLKEYGRMVSTKKYYDVVADLIRDVCEIFDRPRLFHIGFDEEMEIAQRKLDLAVIRRGDLWWHDVNYTIGCVERNGARPVMWADACWTGLEEYCRRMSKAVLQSNWYYHNDFSEAKQKWDTEFEKTGGWGESRNGVAAFLALEKAGFDQLPCGSNWWGDPGSIAALVKFCRERIAPERLKGFCIAPWGSCEPDEPGKRHVSRVFAALDDFCACCGQRQETIMKSWGDTLF